MRSLVGTIVIAAMLTPTAVHAQAQEPHADIGIRLAIAAANGKPANDIPGAGMLAHYGMNKDWTLGAAVDYARYDFEEPAKIVGIVQDPTIDVVDSLAESTTLSLWIERSMTDPSRRTSFFAGAGLGAVFIDVPDVSASRADGGRFDIQTEVDTEIIAFVLSGMRRRFGDRWYGEFAVRLDQHFADWRVTDRISGAQGSIDDYITWGAHLAVGWRW